MTERIFKSMMNKLQAGEYDVNNLWEIYKEICPKTYKDTSRYENKMRYLQFVCMFDKMKHGFEYMFENRIRYVGTNDLHMLVVE